jgi:twitching motility protein PilI
MALPREDLKSFQARVAERLRVAREQGVTASWLAVSIQGLHCLFPLSQANEVLPLTTIIPVPYSKSWFLGAINARGRIYGVVDLADYLVQEARQTVVASPNTNAVSEFSLVGLNTELNLNCVLMVNKVMGLRTLENFPESMQPAADAPDFFGTVYQDVTGTYWQELNLRNLSHSPGFLSISV